MSAYASLFSCSPYCNWIKYFGRVEDIPSTKHWSNLNFENSIWVAAFNFSEPDHYWNLMKIMIWSIKYRTVSHWCGFQTSHTQRWIIFKHLQLEQHLSKALSGTQKAYWNAIISFTLTRAATSVAIKKSTCCFRKSSSDYTGQRKNQFRNKLQRLCVKYSQSWWPYT